MAKNPIKWLNPRKQTPKRKVTGPNGEVVTEKLCPIKPNRKMVDPAGNVVTLALANGYLPKGSNVNYAPLKTQEKLADGFLPYDECPVASGAVPPVKGEKPCPSEEARKRTTHCPHLLRVIEARREAKRKKDEKYAERFKTQNDRILEYLQKEAKRAAVEKDPKLSEESGGALGR